MKGCVADENQSVEIGSDYRESLAGCGNELASRSEAEHRSTFLSSVE